MWLLLWGGHPNPFFDKGLDKILNVAKQALLLWTLGVILSNCGGVWVRFVCSYAAPTSLGPTSNKEAQLLWEESQKAFQESRYQDAVNLLQRYVNRYPGAAEYLKAQYLLAKALLEIGQAKQATPLLIGYISSSRDVFESAEARIALGRSYLAQKKYSEAYLTTLEINRLEPRTQFPSDLQLETLLIKSHALLGLRQESRALNALESAEKKITSQTNSAIKGRILDLKLQGKIRECERLPSHGPLDEAQIRNQFERRGLCLMEALLIFRKILNTEDLNYSMASASEFTQAYRQYARMSITPPKKFRKPQGGQGLSPREEIQYHAELSSLLVRDLKIRTTQALDLISSWKKEIPSSLQAPYSQVVRQLEKWK